MADEKITLEELNRYNWKQYKGTLAGFSRQEYFIRRSERLLVFGLAIVISAQALIIFLLLAGR